MVQDSCVEGRILADKTTPEKQEATNQHKKREENEKVKISWGG